MNEAKIKRLSKVIQTEATTPNIGDFLLTHVPFENLYLTGMHSSSSGKSIKENDVLDNIMLKNPEEHKLLMIQGGNGSGKSHLIRWLKEKYESRVDIGKEKVLLISRAHNTLQDALEQILDSDIFPDEVRENELKAIKNARSNITGEELNKTINFNFTLEIAADEKNQNVILDERMRAWLSTYLLDNYIISQFLMCKSGPIERIRAKLETSDESLIIDTETHIFTANDFNVTLYQINQNLKVADKRAAEFTIKLAEKFADQRSGAELRQRVADYLNSKVSGVIQRSIKLRSADFKNLFSSLRKILKQQNMNLTLFIEDITSFAGLDNALMEVLITNHKSEGNEDYCRIISACGVTTSFYRDSVPDNIKDRVTSHISLSEQSVLGTKSNLAQFAARYINAINLTDEQVSQWVLNGASENDFPLATCDYKWALVNCSGFKLSIFPFNETVLWKLYGSIGIDKRTPRVFLKSVISHVLTLWYSNPDNFLLNEDNFSNADISMPRFDNINYLQNNKAIDEQTALQRGILLKLWGNATTNIEDGRLGNLTADVFKAFNVYAPIEGIPIMPDPVEVKPSTPIITPNIPIPAAKNENLTRIEDDLWSWLQTGTNLRNHIELRDLLKDFIVGSIDWELEGVPDVLVTSYMKVRSRVHIEGQSVEIREGLVLPRSEETSYVLNALAAYKYLGNNTWDFEGSADYLVTSTAWLAKNKSRIVELVIAPENMSKKWNLALFNVAAVYCLKTLFGSVDITKCNEEIAIELFVDAPNYSDSATHGESFKKLQDIVLKNESYKTTVVKESLSYFSKSTGDAFAGDTKYVFVDSTEIMKQIKYLKSINWDLEKICIREVSGNNSTWYYSANLIKVFCDNIQKAIIDEEEKATTYLSLFSTVFDGDFSEEMVKASIESMKEFLKFTTETLNMHYDEEDYNAIKTSTSPNRLAAALNRVVKLNEEQKPYEKLMRLSKSPFDEIDKFYDTFVKFNSFITEKNQKFTLELDTESLNIINTYKNDINQKLVDIDSKIGVVGGLQNENN